jgi:hypothetical protein
MKTKCKKKARMMGGGTGQRRFSGKRDQGVSMDAHLNLAP